MLWIKIALWCCLLSVVVWCKQSDNSWQQQQQPLRLDPVLRRALLRALTQLELEAQKKQGIPTPVQQENLEPPVDEEQEANIKRDLEELLGNYETKFNNQEEQTSPEVVVDPESAQPAPVSVVEYQVPIDEPENVTIHNDEISQREKTEEPVKQESIITFSDNNDNQPFQPESEQKAIFFQSSPEAIEDIVDTQNETSSQLDIRSNIILSSTQTLDGEEVKSANPSKRDQQELSSAKNSVVSLDKPDRISSEEPKDTKLELDDQEVSIFQAPLVAAFTLQQDEKGNPKRVVPLLRNNRPALPSPPPTQQTLTREQELEQKTRLLEQQVLRLQQLQLLQENLAQEEQRRQRFLQEQQQQERLRLEQERLRLQEQERQRQEQERQRQELERQRQGQERLRLQEQERQRQEQERRRQEQERLRQERLRLSLQTPFVAPLSAQDRPRSLRQETGTGIVDFQQSLDFQFRKPQFGPNNNGIQSAASFLSNQQQRPFLPVNNRFNNNAFTQQSQQFSSPAATNFPSNSQNQLFSQQSPQIVSFQPSIQTQPLGFQSPNTNFNSNLRNNLAFNNLRNGLSNPQRELQSLLFQSGIANDLQSNVRNGASPQEDLNIVSKILSLNHEGRRPGREVKSAVKDAGSTAVQQPSAFIAPPKV